MKTLKAELHQPRRGAGKTTLVAFLAMCLLGSFSACHRPQPEVVTVSAAASLTEALQEIEGVYQQSHPEVELRNNYGSSGTLAREIENGAPVDAFVAAASRPMDELEARHLVVAESRRNLLRNSLVLIAPRGSQLSSFEQLRDSHVRTIALGDPASVPAGQYGRQVLASLHLLEGLKARLVLAKDVRQVLAYVETGNADAGIVYATDALTSPKVQVVATAPEATHDPIVYPAAAIANGQHEQAARAFIEYLGTAPARSVFVRRGFTIAGP